MTHPIEDKKCCSECRGVTPTGKISHCLKSFDCPCHAPQKDIGGNWEKEFDEQFVIRARRGIAAGIPQIRTVRAERIKSFISSLLTQERERMERMIDGALEEARSLDKGSDRWSTKGAIVALSELNAKLKNE